MNMKRVDVAANSTFSSLTLADVLVEAEGMVLQNTCCYTTAAAISSSACSSSVAAPAPTIGAVKSPPRCFDNTELRITLFVCYCVIISTRSVYVSHCCILRSRDFFVGVVPVITLHQSVERLL